MLVSFEKGCDQCCADQCCTIDIIMMVQCTLVLDFHNQSGFDVYDDADHLASNLLSTDV